MQSLLETFCTSLYEAGRLWRNTLDKRLKPLGLSQAKWLTLVHLSKGGDGMTQKELAARIGIEGPTLVGLLDRLSADGYIERRESPRDRRSKTVRLCSPGHEILKQINEVAAQLRVELMSDIPEADLQSSIRVLNRIKERAEVLYRRPDPEGANAPNRLVKNAKPREPGEVRQFHPEP